MKHVLSPRSARAWLSLLLILLALTAVAGAAGARGMVPRRDMPSSPQLEVIVNPPPVPTSSVRSVAYVYDGLGRLVQVSYGDVRITYSYDKSGNLLKRSVAQWMSASLPVILKDR